MKRFDAYLIAFIGVMALLSGFYVGLAILDRQISKWNESLVERGFLEKEKKECAASLEEVVTAKRKQAEEFSKRFNFCSKKFTDKDGMLPYGDLLYCMKGLTFD